MSTQVLQVSDQQSFLCNACLYDFPRQSKFMSFFDVCHTVLQKEEACWPKDSEEMTSAKTSPLVLFCFPCVVFTIWVFCCCFL